MACPGPAADLGVAGDHPSAKRLQLLEVLLSRAAAEQQRCRALRMSLTESRERSSQSSALVPLGKQPKVVVPSPGVPRHGTEALERRKPEKNEGKPGDWSLFSALRRAPSAAIWRSHRLQNLFFYKTLKSPRPRSFNLNAAHRGSGRTSFRSELQALCAHTACQQRPCKPPPSVGAGAGPGPNQAGALAPQG